MATSTPCSLGAVQWLRRWESRCSCLMPTIWTWSWYVLGKIVRGELWEALDGLHEMRSLALLPMLAWSAGYEREGYRRLEQKLDAAAARRLSATVATLDRQSLHSALAAEMALFRDLRDAVFSRYALEYDPSKESALREIVLSYLVVYGAGRAALDSLRGD